MLFTLFTTTNIMSQGFIGNLVLESTWEWDEESKSFKYLKNDFIGDVRVFESGKDGDNTFMMIKYKNKYGDVLFEMKMTVTRVSPNDLVDTYYLKSDEGGTLLLEISNEYLLLYFDNCGDNKIGYRGYRMIEQMKPYKLK